MRGPAPDHDRSSDPAGGGPSEEDLYDLYLEAAREGRAEEPARFLASHPEAGEELRSRIAAIHRLARATSVGPWQTQGLPREPEPDLPFERLGEYRLLRALGMGGMGTVYEAYQESLGRTVALKVVRSDLRRAPEALERFRREARMVAKLRHPGIVNVLGAGDDQGVRYLAMDLVPGRSLEEILDAARASGEAIPPARVARWGARIAAALHYAHQQGVIHRDVKPSNILVTPEDEPLLLDFGVAREQSGELPTLTRAFVGSPLYAAPEQLKGTTPSPLVDVYSVGATLYHCLTRAPAFEASTVDQIFHNVLTEPPPPPRRGHPEIPRDLEVIVLKAMEKDPRRRYGSAEELAEDLEALLAFRPISARPPGPARRLADWGRRRPGLAAAIGTGLLAAVALVTTLVVQDVQERARTRREAAQAVRDGSARLDAYLAHVANAKDLEKRLDELNRRLQQGYVPPEDDRDIGDWEDTVADLQVERERAFQEVEAHLRRATRLDPEVAGVSEVRAALYLQRHREAVALQDEKTAALFAGRAREEDPEGRLTGELARQAQLFVRTDPPGAAVYAFRLEMVPGRERRIVPVPVAGEPALEPGTWCLRVVRGAGDLRADDYVVIEGIDDPVETRAVAERGGLRAVVVRNGERRDVMLPEGLAVRPTAAPAPIAPACRIAEATPAEVTVDHGAYLLVVRLAGYEDQRLYFSTRAGTVIRFAVRLLPEGTSPEGFVRVVNLELPDPPPPFWIMDHEVTAAHYLEFLNDPETLSRIGGTGQPPLVPRGTSEWPWTRDDAGTFRVPEGWAPDWPVVGVSFADARAYARWRTRRDRAAGHDRTYALPTLRQHVDASCDNDRRFVFGNRFRPKWVKSVYARPKPGMEPVLSFPIDESPLGVFDLSGSVIEWSADWYGEEGGARRANGGSWAHGRAAMFEIWGGAGFRPDYAGPVVGFRLVMTEDAK